MQSNWNQVIEGLAAHGRMQIAGALRPAKVTDFSDGVLRLGFDENHEALRRRCQGQMKQAIDQAFSQLAGREIRCEVASAGQDAPLQNTLAGLSTAEKAEIQKDPAVREVLGLFGGEVVDIRKQAPQVNAPPADENNGAD